MNQKKFIKVLSAAAVLAAFGLAACGDDSSSSPVVPDGIASSEATLTSSETVPSSDSQVTSSENSQPTSSGNEQPTSSDSNPVSSSDIVASSSSTVNPESSSTEVSSSSNVTESCRHITDVGDPMKPHPCDTEFEVAMDCAKNYYLMCAGGIWLNATGCDTTQEKCGFDDYKLCMDYHLRDYCSDDWLNEPCEDGDSRSYRKYDSTDSTSYSSIDYVCVDGKWVDRMSLYCSGGKGCGSGGFQDCWQSDIIGTTCNERDPEASWISKDGCDFQCRDGKYEFVPPPTM